MSEERLKCLVPEHRLDDSLSLEGKCGRLTGESRVVHLFFRSDWCNGSLEERLGLVARSRDYSPRMGLSPRSYETLIKP